MTVLFVGSNPSKKNADPSIPFKGTRSEDILKRWITDLNIFNYHFINVLDEITENNRQLTRKEIKNCIISLANKINSLKYDKIVALGNTASEALKLLKLTHFKMPHPSGRNRLLNSKKFVDKQIESCKVYLYERD